MSGTIEATNKKIAEKIATIKLIFDQLIHLTAILDKLSVDYKSSLKMKFLHLNLLQSDFDELEISYNLSIVGNLAKYYSAEGRHLEEINTKEFYRIIDSENYIPRINEFLDKAKNILELLITAYNKKPKEDPIAAPKRGRRQKKKPQTIELSDDDSLFPIVEKIKRQVQNAESIVVSIETKKNKYDTCDCGSKMIFLPESSELYCQECQEVKTLYGTITDDLQTGSFDGVKTKQGKYDPTRHFKFWMERTQARERKIFPPDHLDRIERIKNRDQIEIRSIYDMRSLLKEAKLTQYNDHGPLLMKTFTGVSPPQLGFTTLRKFSIKFNKIIDCLEHMKNPEDNRPYYPYFIYKIAEGEAENAKKRGEYEEERELRRLLLYIHLQSDDTVTKNDILFEGICKMCEPSDDLEFTPTDKVAAMAMIL